MTGPTLPVDAETFVPHRPPLRLVDRLLQVAGEAGTVETVLGPDSLVVEPDGTLSPVVFIELIAQAYAAVRGCEQRLAGRPVPVGLLVGVPQARFLASGPVRLTGPTRFEVRVRTAGSFAGFWLADGEVWRDRECLASGTVKVWSPEAEPPAPAVRGS